MRKSRFIILASIIVLLCIVAMLFVSCGGAPQDYVPTKETPVPHYYGELDVVCFTWSGQIDCVNIED